MSEDKRLSDLFRGVTWAQVEAVLRREYPEYVYELEEFHYVYQKMCELEPVPDTGKSDSSELWVMFTESVQVLGGRGEVRYVDVSGTDLQIDPHQGGIQRLGLDFVPWSECLGMRILEETRARYSDAEIVAHCLMELTFWGGDDGARQAEAQGLQEACCEGFEESRPAEEFWRELGLDPVGREPGGESMEPGTMKPGKLKPSDTLLAVYSDVHGDLDALSSAYAQTLWMGCMRHLCLGDFVDEARPAEGVIAFVQEKGIQCIRGNHERWLLNALGEGGYDHPLSPEAVAFLKALPSNLDLIIDGVRVAAHHARPGSDMDGLDEEDLSMAGLRGLLAEAACDVLLVGHTHRALVSGHPGGGLVANPGALGRPPFVPEHFQVALISTDGVALMPSDEEGAGQCRETFGVLHARERLFEVRALGGFLVQRGGGGSGGGGRGGSRGRSGGRGKGEE